MLVPAKLHEIELQAKMATTVIDPYYSLWHGAYANTVFSIDDNTWSNLQLASVVNDKVIGYFKAHWDRAGGYIESMACVHFPENRDATKLVFAIDMRNFLKYLVETLNVPKIAWSVYRGNPVEKHYDRLAKKFGGRIMGIDRYATKINGKWYDLKHYEWINDYHECTNCGVRVKKEAEVMCWKCGIGEMIYKNPFKD